MNHCWFKYDTIKSLIGPTELTSGRDVPLSTVGTSLKPAKCNKMQINGRRKIIDNDFMTTFSEQLGFRQYVGNRAITVYHRHTYYRE